MRIERTSTSRVRMTQAEAPTKATSVHKPLFDSPTKHGGHHAIATFTPTERRFQWQNVASSTDALYRLPTSIGAGPKKGFGTSTREDWDVQRKRGNPCAGPGSYEALGACKKQPVSTCRSMPVTAFDMASRSSLHSDATPSPGPIYELPEAIGAAPGTRFGTALRQPLNGRTEGPGPNLALKGSFKEVRPGVSPTFGTEKRLRAPPSANIPGPMYDLSPTGYRTGASFSFGHAKRFG